MNYPLNMSFKLFALANQIRVTDATDSMVCYVKQKMFKLKEAITVFADTGQTQPLYTINADRVLDFSARYHFADTTGRPLGSVARKGMRSLWRASYDIFDGETVVMHIAEENPWVKVMDGVMCQIPLLGLVSGFVFHPAYLVSRPGGGVIMRLQKRPAFFEGKFSIEKMAPLNQDEELRALLSLMMLVLLERSRG